MAMGVLEILREESDPYRRVAQQQRVHSKQVQIQIHALWIQRNRTGVNYFFAIQCGKGAYA